MTWAAKTGHVITVEENALQGGFGSAVLEVFQEESFVPKSVTRLGVPDVFIPHGKQSILRNMYGIDAEAIENTAHQVLDSHHAKILHAIGQTGRR
jgi:1-deoxy-D-xylulose-5-phosphate synthase